MADRCCAYLHGKRCRATKDLENVIVMTTQSARPAYEIPTAVHVQLCPKHFTRIEDSNV